MRRGASRFVAVSGVVIVIAVLATGGVLFTRGDQAKKFDPILTVAEIAPFEATVLEQGQLESSDNVEFRCEIKSRYDNPAVIAVVPEGTLVKPGDVLVRLDRSKLEQAHQTQIIAVNNAEKLVQQASSKLQAAEIAKVEYLEGKFEETHATIRSEIFVAEEELRKAEEYARFSERLAAKSFVTENQLQADLFAVERYRISLELARQKLKVLEQQTKPKEIIAFDSEILSSQAELASAEKARDVEVEALKEINDQLAKCDIVVPEGFSGQVVYANVFSSRGNSEWVLEEGAQVRERQVLMRLPNLAKMQIYAKVNEAQIAAVLEGMPVVIQVDAIRSQGPLQGKVTKVNAYAEPESWSSGGIRRYGVTIELVDPPTNIRPGMNASVTIQTRFEPAALQIPVQAFAEHEGKYYAVVKTETGFETREISVVAANAKTAWIESGINAGDQVVMAPRSFDGLLELPAEASSDSQQQQLARNPATPATDSASSTAASRTAVTSTAATSESPASGSANAPAAASAETANKPEASSTSRDTL